MDPAGDLLGIFLSFLLPLFLPCPSYSSALSPHSPMYRLNARAPRTTHREGDCPAAPRSGTTHVYLRTTVAPGIAIIPGTYECFKRVAQTACGCEGDTRTNMSRSNLLRPLLPRCAGVVTKSHPVVDHVATLGPPCATSVPRVPRTSSSTARHDTHTVRERQRSLDPSYRSLYVLIRKTKT